MRKYLEGGEELKAFEIEVPDDLKDMVSVRFPVLYIKVGEEGYWPGREVDRTIPPDVALSAIEASMFGWNSKAAAKALEYAETH
jgi:hypothetical protein